MSSFVDMGCVNHYFESWLALDYYERNVNRHLFMGYITWVYTLINYYRKKEYSLNLTLYRDHSFTWVILMSFIEDREKSGERERRRFKKWFLIHTY